MKLPSLWPVLFFAGGILLPGTSAIHAPLIVASRFSLVAGAFLLLAALILLHREWLFSAAIGGAALWLCLGFAAAGFDRISVPANLASTLVESGKLDSSATLRWRGHLRAEPLRLPWGMRYEIELSEVESSAGITSTTGGLQLTSYRDGSKATVPPPAVHAGDHVEVLARAQPVRNFGDPGSFDFRSYLALQNINLQGTLRNDALLTVIDRPAPNISARFARLRGRLLDSIDNMFSQQPDSAALARAMLLGDRTFVDRDLVAQYQKTGVYHVLVLAGLHVGALVAFFIWAGRSLRLNLLARTVITLVALLSYTAIVDDRPPILRAAIMAAIYLTARLIYRRMDLLNVAALSALAILAMRPGEIRNPSFLLSFAVVGVIGALAIPFLNHSTGPYMHGLTQVEDISRDVIHRPHVIQFRIELRALISWFATRTKNRVAALLPKLFVILLRNGIYLWDLFVISAILQLGMLPSLAYYFHRVIIAAPFANIPAVLLTGLIVSIGFFTLGISLVSRSLATLLAKFLGLALTMLNVCVQWFAQWHGASYRIREPPLALIAAFAIAVVVLSAAMRTRLRHWQWVTALVLAILAMVIATYPFSPRLKGSGLEVTILDVGQGDSLFVTFPDRRTMLIDSGGSLGSFQSHGMRSGMDIGEDVVSPYLWSRGLKRIDVIALTHAHQDHMGGLPAILDNFDVGELWVGHDIANASYQHVLEIAREHGVRVVHHKLGDAFAHGDVSGTFLWPEDSSENAEPKNDDSLVIRLTEGSESLLLTGDIERPSERKILAADEAVSANFLKIAHHGSKTSTTDPFLLATHPSVAAISVGRDNGFGHPSPEVVERLEAAGVRIFRTDRDGAITVRTDGRTLTATSFLPANK